MLANAQILRYDPARYPFTAVLERTVYKTRPLELLHTACARRKGSRVLTYEDNLALRALMQKLPDDSPFMRLYHRFIREVVAPPFRQAISYSSRPKMRIHLAGTGSVSLWHRDVDVTGRPDQINVFLPFTRCFDTNALWCESEIGRKDYRPLPLEVGEALLFDGGCLEHGTVPNETGITRCSLDFRFAVKGAGRRVPAPWSEILAGRPADMGGNPLAR